MHNSDKLRKWRNSDSARLISTRLISTRLISQPCCPSSFYSSLDTPVPPRFLQSLCSPSTPLFLEKAPFIDTLLSSVADGPTCLYGCSNFSVSTKTSLSRDEALCLEVLCLEKENFVERHARICLYGCSNFSVLHYLPLPIRSCIIFHYQLHLAFSCLQISTLGFRCSVRSTSLQTAQALTDRHGTVRFLDRACL